ncbi:hypothetical protein M2351_008203 [Azospirillum canadense]|nr:hypothetical protein [Azospirillum canadense]
MTDGVRATAHAARPEEPSAFRRLARLLPPWAQRRDLLDPERLSDHLRRDLGFQDGRDPPPHDRCQDGRCQHDRWW